MRFSMKVLIALGVTLTQAYVYSLGKVGDGPFPLWIPLIITTLYALITRSYMLAFLVGFLSIMTFPLGVFWFYYLRGSIQLPDLNGWLNLIAWSSLFGLIGLLTVKISNVKKNKQNVEGAFAAT